MIFKEQETFSIQIYSQIKNIINKLNLTHLTYFLLQNAWLKSLEWGKNKYHAINHAGIGHNEFALELMQDPSK